MEMMRNSFEPQKFDELSALKGLGIIYSDLKSFLKKALLLYDPQNGRDGRSLSGRDGGWSAFKSRLYSILLANLGFTIVQQNINSFAYLGFLFFSFTLRHAYNFASNFIVFLLMQNFKCCK